MTQYDILIVGTGQAALQLAGFLRDEGFSGSIAMIGEEPHLPYQRPPLSKAYMNGDCEAGQLFFQPRQWFDDRSINLRGAVRVMRIDRAGRFVETDGGEHLHYGKLVLATGARNRRLPVFESVAQNCAYLRSLDDASAMRDKLVWARRIAVVGGGFLGLEFAAIAASKSKRVTVIEAGSGLMGRAVCPEIGLAFQQHQEKLGVRFAMNTTVESIAPMISGGYRLGTSDGQEIDADLIVGSVGVIPNMELAQQAGLETGDGIIVDDMLFSSDPDIAAVGDCASFRSLYAPGHCRIESVQNALDQPRALARTLAGTPTIYDALPWFWSDQGGLKLQIAGLSIGADQSLLRGDVAGGKFSAYRFREGRLVAVESVGRPTDHMTARRILASATTVTPAHIEDEGCDLKSLLAA